MPFVSGFLRMRRRPGRPVDPGWGVDEGLHPDQGLPPGEGPVDPDYGISEEHPSHPIELPPPPPGLWPPPTVGHPIVPVPPGVDVGPPGTIWPSPGHPAHPIAPGGRPRPPGRPDQGLPGGGGVPDQGLPGGPPTAGQLPTTQKFVVVALIPGYGVKYIVVDPSLRPDQGLPETQPPQAQPR